MLLKTSLNAVHKQLNARMVDFGGWEMPVVYTNQIEEHNAVRNAAGIFDVSHMGEFSVTGKDAFALIQELCSKNIEGMENGRIHLTVFCDENGGIIDDLTIYKYTEEQYMLVVNAGTTPYDFEWCKKHAEKYDVQLDNISDNITKLDLQGPKAEQILQRISDTDLSSIKRYWFKVIKIDGVEMVVSRSGYTGEDGFELYFANSEAEHIWNKILEVGKPDGLLPCGLGSRDTLRTECGMMLYGHDIDREHTPLEAVYGWVVSFEKDFVGKAALQKQQEEGLKRKLAGFEMTGRGIARNPYPIYYNGEEVGVVTSGTPSPTTGKNIGMGYIRYDLRKPDTEIDIKIRDNFVKAKIVKLPFYKK
ncbi:MAG: glycine cleavage system aminomethyltransferase GcvT [Candidatus Gracilibacteria bacterium]|jgi:aminomethyltransferase